MYYNSENSICVLVESLFLGGFLFLSTVLRPSFLKLKPIVEYENRYGHARTGRIDCAGLAVTINKTGRESTM